MADVVTVSCHLSIPEPRTYMTTDAADDLAAADVPMVAGECGRSAQTFTVDVVVHAGDMRRRVITHGQDIQALSALPAVEALDAFARGRAASPPRVRSRRTGLPSCALPAPVVRTVWEFHG